MMISYDFVYRLEALLKTDERFYHNQTQQLYKNKLIEHANQLDKTLIQLLLSDKRVKDAFFRTIDNVTLFDKEKFIFYPQQKFLPAR